MPQHFDTMQSPDGSTWVRLDDVIKALTANVEALERWDCTTEYNHGVMEEVYDGCWINREEVLHTIQHTGEP